MHICVKQTHTHTCGGLTYSCEKAEHFFFTHVPLDYTSKSTTYSIAIHGTKHDAARVAENI